MRREYCRNGRGGGDIYVTERSQSWSGDVRLRGGFEMRYRLTLSYLYVLKSFPIDKKDRNFRCLFSKTSDYLQYFLVGFFNRTLSIYSHLAAKYS